MTLEVNKDYVFKSSFTGEEFTACYRGEAQDGKIVVWTGRTQLTIPKEWAMPEKPESDKYQGQEDDTLWAKGIRRGEQYKGDNMKSEITQMREWLDNRDRHSGKIRRAELRYIRAKCHELEAQYKARTKARKICQEQGTHCLACALNCVDRLYARAK